MTMFTMNCEIFTGNGLYGHNDILKSYCGFPTLLPLPVSLQHGWATVMTTPDWYSRSPLHAVWVWCRDDQAALSGKRECKTIIGGAPFIYLFNRDVPFKQPESRKGTIVFPAHATKSVGTILDFDRYAEALDQLPGEFQPITVNMYWYDLQLGNDKPFKDKGFKIVTCGKSENTGFLRHFIRFANTHRYASSNRISTASLYAGYMGLRVFKYGPDVVFNNFSDALLPKGIVKSLETDPRRKKMGQYFTMDSIEDNKQQFEVCANELGLPYKLSKETMLHRLLDTINENYIVHSFQRCKPFMRDLKRSTAVNRVLSKSKIIISGNGSHTRELLRDFPLLKEKVIAISTIDRSRDQLEGIPVIDEAEINQMDYEAILISSHSYEKDIYRRLKEKGIPGETLFLIYSRVT